MFESHLVRLDGQRLLGGSECFIQIINARLIGLSIVIDRLVMILLRIRLRDEVLRRAVRCQGGP